MYASESPHTVYCYECWQSDKWDAASYGAAFDVGRSFLEQFKELKKTAPRMGLVKQGDMETSQYCNRASNNRNCYLCFRASSNEDCYYCHYLVESKDCMDCFNVNRCELSYGSIDCFDCYNVRFCQEAQNCSDSAFLYDCRNCSDCFGCINLRNKRHCIFNVQYSAEEYARKTQEWDLTNPETLEKAKGECKKVFARGIRPALVSIRSEHVTGNLLYSCGNVKDSYMCKEVENGRYLVFITRGKDLMDVFHFGFDIESVYESANCGISSSQIKFSNECFTSNSGLEYCDNCVSCTDCFGCVGLRNKKYHILNKAYAPEEYSKIVAGIKKQMDEIPYKDQQGRVYKYGEFFPPELSSFCYNETVAQMYFPLLKEEVLVQGFRWRDQELREAKAVPGAVLCVHGGICNHGCTGAFKIIPQEQEYYRRMKIVPPALCPNCRHGARVEMRTPMVLHQRTCGCVGERDMGGAYKNKTAHEHGAAPCKGSFETTHPPDSPATVYCEACYQAEVV